MQKEDVVKILNDNGYVCEIQDNVPIVYLNNYNPDIPETFVNTKISIKRLIPDYNGSIGYRPLKNKRTEEVQTSDLENNFKKVR